MGGDEPPNNPTLQMKKENGPPESTPPATESKNPIIEALDIARQTIGDAAAAAAMQEAMRLKVRSEEYLKLMIDKGIPDARLVIERFRNRINYAFEKRGRKDDASVSLVTGLNDIINRLA